MLWLRSPGNCPGRGRPFQLVLRLQGKSVAEGVEVVSLVCSGARASIPRTRNTATAAPMTPPVSAVFWVSFIESRS